MKIFYSAVFDNQGVSSDNSKVRELEALGHTVVSYDYRVRGLAYGKNPNISKDRDNEIIKFCENWRPDFIIFAKCNGVDLRVFEECKKIAPLCYWFADPLITYTNEEFYQKTKIADFFTCDKINVFEVAKNINKNSFIVNDGYDRLLEYPKKLNKIYDLTFIGNLYGDRADKVKQLKRPLKIINNAFGHLHSKAVAQSKINLNICTSAGPSDRVFKVLGAGGFLLTDDWPDRSNFFEDGKDLVIYKDFNDLNEKIEYYLNNEIECEKIAKHGSETVKKYTRQQWAMNTVKLYHKFSVKRELPQAKENVLIAGPWVGEFGWELFAWHGYIRSLSKYYDKTVCISTKHSEFLYEDFCDTFIKYDPEEGDYKDSFYKVNHQITNKVLMKFINEASLSPKKQNLSFVMPRRIGDPPRTHYTEKFNFGPLYVAPEYKKLGVKSEPNNTILVHARNRSLRTQDNWPEEKWNILVDNLLKCGYNVVSIGLKKEALHIKGSKDLRECKQQELLNLLANSVCIFGPSSGAMHLASMCGCPQVVWTTNYNFDRYTENWNPHKADVLFLSEQGWQPSPEFVIEKFNEWKNNESI